ncbi:hypothetical protein SUGI_1120000 [Cryptomeria japonica]|nr:hypothetical protein SUGI_1120000 [Cryptomeria japonica]
MIKQCIGWTGFATGASEGLCIMGRIKKVSIQLLETKHNWMKVEIKSLGSDLQFILYNIYGPTKTTEKLELWTCIQNDMQSHREKITLGGNFNTILYTKDKMGGLSRMGQVHMDYAKFVRNVELVDFVPTNGKYAWTNRQKGFSNIVERLDRLLLTDVWNGSNFQPITLIRPCPISNHSPLKLNLIEDSHPTKSQFKF